MQEKGKVTVIAAFIIMLSLGSVYSWSIFVPGLKEIYQLTTAQTQLIFGTLIAVFTLTMVAASNQLKKKGPRLLTLLSGMFFGVGYLLAFFSKGNFMVLWLGIGGFAGIGTGLGYLVALTIPVRWFPSRKGLVTGLVAGGFGAGAIIFTYIADYWLELGWDVLQVFQLMGIAFGLLIVLLGLFIFVPKEPAAAINMKNSSPFVIPLFLRLFAGIFGGTFAGLMIIGNLRPIGISSALDTDILILSIAIFSFANFLGRLIWGWLSDVYNPGLLIPISLIISGLSALLLGAIAHTHITFVLLAVITGFQFGANFVLFARDTMNKFGSDSYARIYSYVFLGYGLAGVIGPFVGGWLYDVTNSYMAPLSIAALICVSVATIYAVSQNEKKFRLSKFRILSGETSR